MLDIKPGYKLFVFILIDTLIILALILYFVKFHDHENIKINGTYIKASTKINDFQFLDTQGEIFSRKNLQGRWSILFSGFTECPVICPTTLAELNKMYKALQKNLPENEWPQVIFVTVDPETDTLAVINKYLTAFNSNFIGIRGDSSSINRLQKNLHMTTSQGNPNSHSMEILLINPRAEVQAYFSYPHHFETLAADYISILKVTKIKI